MNKATIFAVIVLMVLIGSIAILATRDNPVGSVIEVNGTNEVIIYEFYGKGCSHCSKLASWFKEISPKYPNLIIKEHEIYQNNTNRELFRDMSKAYGFKMGGVPTIFIGNVRIVGFSNEVGKRIEEEIQRCTQEGCIDPLEFTNSGISIEDESSPLESPEKTKLKDQITLGAVIGAAIVDAINPCAFAVLIILLTTILAAKVKKRVLCAGLAFTFSIYLSYLLMGLGLYSAINAAGLSHWFYGIVAVLAIIVGLFNIKDYFAYGKWFVMEVPMSWRPKLQCIIKGVTSVPGAFLIGFVVSLFLLPCTSGPYIVILGLLAKATTKNYALMMMMLYNFIFVLPMLIITCAIYWGFTTTKKAEQWRKSKLRILHLIAGLIILTLGIGMLAAMYLGYV